MSSPQTATTSFGHWEVALQTIEDPERMILIESTESGKNQKNFFFFEIHGQLAERAGMVGLLRGLIGSFCLYPISIFEMKKAILQEMKTLFEDNACPLTAFMLMRIDSESTKMSMAVQNFPLPISLFTPSNPARKDLENEQIDLEAGPEEPFIIFPSISKNDSDLQNFFRDPKINSSFDRSVSALAFLLELNRTMNGYRHFFQEISFKPLACIRRTSR